MATLCTGARLEVVGPVWKLLPNKDGAWSGSIDSGDEICLDSAPISELVPAGVAHRMDISLESWPEAADKMVHGEVVHFPEFHSPGRAERRQRAAVLCSYHQFFFPFPLSSNFPPNCSSSIPFGTSSLL